MKPASAHTLFEALIAIGDSGARSDLIARNSKTISLDLIERLSVHIRKSLPKDPGMGESLTESCFLLAEILDEPLGWAHANRSRACVFTNLKKCQEAEPFYETASRLFEDAGSWRELGRTEIIHAENLTYLSQYSEAQARASKAYGLLKAYGDPDDLAKVHIFAGNLFNRLNRYADALAEYDRARDVLGNSDDYMAVAAVELNRASVLVELNRFDEAIRGLETAREYCDRHRITVWADILDRNIARLYFSLGRYSEALRSLNRPRPRYRETGDARRLALCDQACASIYLQLNMFREAEELALRAYATFDAYANRSEAAECLGMVGVAQAERHDPAARGSFLRAIDVFRQEGNSVSMAGLELQLGRLEMGEGEYVKAAELARRAAEAFEAEGLGVRGAYARLVVAETEYERGDGEMARRQAQEALGSLSGYHARWVSYQCRNLLGRLHAEHGEVREAERLYREAIADIESLRGNLELDEFRTSFGRDKFKVYENLVALLVEAGDVGEAFRVVERSRSRTLIDLLEHNTQSVWEASTHGEKQQTIQRLRYELNGLYSRISRRGVTVGSVSSDAALRTSIREREREMVQTLRDAATERQGWAALETTPASSIADIQRMLSPDEALIEYYTIDNRFVAFLVDRSGAEFYADLASVHDVRESLRGLNFQLSKFHLSSDYLEERGELLLAATLHHLKDLYEMLVGPLEARLRASSLVIVPHGLTHYVPFQALFDGDLHLVDRYDFVYGASATVLKICREKPRRESTRDLVLAVPDAETPAILDEALMLKDLLPAADVYLGEEARADLLSRHGESVGILHIAAHGVFRSDSPLFSSLRLGDTWLNLVDVFNLRLGSELTTLSGCETGMSSIYGGDELLGLTQGFLYAGTPSLVVSLWRVHDRSTTQLMSRFYEELLAGTSKPRALRLAAMAVKQKYPHPYYWAPFVLLGKS